jgi:hypothetical protein
MTPLSQYIVSASLQYEAGSQCLVNAADVSTAGATHVFSSPKNHQGSGSSSCADDVIKSCLHVSHAVYGLEVRYRGVEKAAFVRESEFILQFMLPLHHGRSPLIFRKWPIAAPCVVAVCANPRREMAGSWIQLLLS